jgi:hypothetical protein
MADQLAGHGNHRSAALMSVIISATRASFQCNSAEMLAATTLVLTDAYRLVEQK